jgi:phage regulator Rha-like protein
MPDNSEIVPIGEIEQRILLIRGQRVIIDADLARLYDVSTKQLNQAIRRNIERFPDDFMLQLTWDEAQRLRSQIVTLNVTHTGGEAPRRGQHMKYRPYAFTEHGAIMAASVLKTEQAVKVSVYVVRAFVKLREMLSAHKELAAKLAELERKLDKHDGQIVCLIEAIRQLMTPPPEPKRKPIGFASER